jgi:hypothetical protein
MGAFWLNRDPALLRLLAGLSAQPPHAMLGQHATLPGDCWPLLPGLVCYDSILPVAYAFKAPEQVPTLWPQEQKWSCSDPHHTSFDTY